MRPFDYYTFKGSKTIGSLLQKYFQGRKINSLETPIVTPTSIYKYIRVSKFNIVNGLFIRVPILH